MAWQTGLGAAWHGMARHGKVRHGMAGVAGEARSGMDGRGEAWHGRRDSMNHNVYLPDDVSQRAREAGLPLSRLLRAAVLHELEMAHELDQLERDIRRQQVGIPARYQEQDDDTH